MGGGMGAGGCVYVCGYAGVGVVEACRMVQA